MLSVRAPLINSHHLITSNIYQSLTTTNIQRAHFYTYNIPHASTNTNIHLSIQIPSLILLSDSKYYPPPSLHTRIRTYTNTMSSTSSTTTHTTLQYVSPREVVALLKEHNTDPLRSRVSVIDVRD